MNPICAKSRRVHGLLLVASAALLFLAGPPAYGGQHYDRLLGCWQCREAGQRVTLEFESETRLLHNSEPANYQAGPEIIRVQFQGTLIDYYYRLEDERLLIFGPDGSLIQCRKTSKPPQAAQPSGQVQQVHPPGPQPQGWPPYAKPPTPPGGYTGNESDLASLVWKFAGKWSHYTPHRETHLYLAPDGSYSDSSDASFGGQLYDQGGYQTGSWAGAGSDRSKGRWYITGTLRQGRIILTEQDGSQVELAYQVHIKNGEIYWGEYFFNGNLFSVDYIYR